MSTLAFKGQNKVKVTIMMITFNLTILNVSKTF